MNEEHLVSKLHNLSLTQEEKNRYDEISNELNTIETKSGELYNESTQILKRARLERFKNLINEYIGRAVYINVGSCKFYGRIISLRMLYDGEINSFKIKAFNPYCKKYTENNRWDKSTQLFYTCDYNPNKVEFISDEIYNHMFTCFMDSLIKQIPDEVSSWKYADNRENLAACYINNGFSESDIYDDVEDDEPLVCDEKTQPTRDSYNV